jgi:hypothetical protein
MVFHGDVREIYHHHLSRLIVNFSNLSRRWDVIMRFESGVDVNLMAAAPPNFSVA